MKRCVLLIIALSFLLLPGMTNFAQADSPGIEGTWIADGNYAAAFAGGTGTKTDPYQISNAAQLARLSRLAHDGTEGSTVSNTKYYILTDDITLYDHEWVPIGYDNVNPFYGSFDGKNYKITGIRLTKPFPCIGLFGYVGFPNSQEGLLKNIDVSGNITLNQQSWSVANASIGGIAALSSTGFDNCHADLSVDVKLVPNCGLNELCISGIGSNAYSDNHKTLNCSSSGYINVSCTESSLVAESYPNVDIGGISGWASVINNSFSVVRISVQSGLHAYIGGICSFGGTCVNCYYGGIITADSSLHVVGNILGGHGSPEEDATTDCYVYNCYWNVAFQVPNDANHDGIGQAGDYSINSGTFTGSSNQFKIGQTDLEDKLNEWASQDSDKYRLWRKSRVNDDRYGLLVNGSWDSWLWCPVFDTGDVTWREIMTGLEKKNPWKSLDGSTTATKAGDVITVEGGTIKGGVYIRSKVVWPGGQVFDYENPSGTYILKNLNTEGFYIWAADGYSYNVQFENTVTFGSMFNYIYMLGNSVLNLTLDTAITNTDPDTPLFIDIESDATLTIKGNGSISPCEAGWYRNDDQLEHSSFYLAIECLGDSIDQCVDNLAKLYQRIDIDENLVASTENKLSVPVYLDLVHFRYSYSYRTSTLKMATSEEELKTQDSSKPRMLLSNNSNLSLWSEFKLIDNQAALYHIEARNGGTTLHPLPGTGTLYFPYPDGTSMTTDNNFKIHHYTGHGIIDYSTKDGTIQKTPYGLAVKVKELSPFIIEWDGTAAEPTPSPTPVPASPAAVPTNIPRTGDGANPGVWIMISLLGLIGVIAFSGRKAGKHRK